LCRQRGGTIAITRSSANLKIVATTGKDGHYSIRNLSSGDYMLEVTHEGFVSQSLQITLGRGKRKKLSIVLSPVVSGQSARGVSTSSSAQAPGGSTQGLADSKAVSDLPSNGRDLLRLAPPPPFSTLDYLFL